MEDGVRFESRLARAVEGLAGNGCPPRLARALRHAVRGGARVRPRLAYRVARGVGREPNPLTDAVAVAVELLHAASLVHDDLPCFDDAPTRRGRPTVHRLVGEPVAILAGDALIAGAFGEVARAAPVDAVAACAIGAALARAAGAPAGMAAGQAWESEPAPELERVHAGKTAALFEAAAAGGAVSVGAPPEGWRRLGRAIGVAYQLADDVRDHGGDDVALGKPVGRDAALGRPSAVRAFGLEESLARLRASVRRALDLVPPGARREEVRAFVGGLFAGAAA